MAWGAIGSAAITTAGGLLGKKGGGGGGQRVSVGFKSPGFKVALNDYTGVPQIVRTDERQSLIDSLKQNYFDSAASVRGTIPELQGIFDSGIGRTRGLLDSVAVGSSGLRKSKLDQLEDARQKSLSDLRSNISRRRLSGSSFGQNEQVRADLAFGKEAERIAAESFLEELALSNELGTQLLKEELLKIDTTLQSTLGAFELERAAGTLELEDQNYMAQLVSGIATQSTALAQENNRLSQERAAQNAAGSGSFFGDIAGQLTSNLDFGNIFGGSTSSSSLLSAPTGSPAGFSVGRV